MKQPLSAPGIAVSLAFLASPYLMGQMTLTIDQSAAVWINEASPNSVHAVYETGDANTGLHNFNNRIRANFQGNPLGQTKSLIRFDVSPLAGLEIVDVRLRFSAFFAAGGSPIQLSEMLRDWTADSATGPSWNLASVGGDAWNEPGVTSPLDRDSPFFSYVHPEADSGTWYTFEIFLDPLMVESWVTGPNYGILLESSDDTSHAVHMRAPNWNALYDDFAQLPHLEGDVYRTLLAVHPSTAPEWEKQTRPVLLVTAVPEPSTYALIAGAFILGIVVFSRRVRRNRKS